jgi:DNA mismatch repair protein MSH4
MYCAHLTIVVFWFKRMHGAERNISTFMLEMKEIAFICREATNRSLVLIDELGRATSNEDGVALAWAVSESLLHRRALTFFVTHYSQVTSLGNMYAPSVQNQHMSATVACGEVGRIAYTHKVAPGPCAVDSEYGVDLASACAWPETIVFTQVAHASTTCLCVVLISAPFLLLRLSGSTD